MMKRMERTTAREFLVLEPFVRLLLADSPISVEGKRYFTCPPSKGAFTRPKRVKVGDFPPEELNLDDDEEV